MSSHQIQVVGVAWFRRDDWSKVKAIFVDSHKLHEAYDDWLAAAEQFYRRIEGQGMRVEKVYIDPDTFPEWCRARGLRINADARQEFAGFTVAQKYAGNSS
ncbi:hypothetical protein [Fodinicurvata sp. EGI_FJ10296]|uniref:hypothetical protein n=1 Tax=Fodinicurvata sp. EGI_FJ10296 TaxID=3231908 RepID=UPI003456C2AB